MKTSNHSPAGTWIDSNASTCLCELGAILPRLVGGCIKCGAGFQTNGYTSAATTCDGCLAGKIAKTKDVVCTNCVAGRSSPEKAQNCTICEAGRYASSEGSPTCWKCGVGESTHGRAESTTAPPAPRVCSLVWAVRSVKIATVENSTPIPEVRPARLAPAPSTPTRPRKSARSACVTTTTRSTTTSATCVRRERPAPRRRLDDRAPAH